MIFGRVLLVQSRGAILAHSWKMADRILRKGALIDATSYNLLELAGYTEVTIARFEPGDIPEGEAVAQFGQLLPSTGLRRSDDLHGRVNLFADFDGLLRFDADKIDQLNLIDEAITLATLPDRSVVGKGDMIAALKVISFAFSVSSMEISRSTIVQVAPIFALIPFRKLRVGLILTELPPLKGEVITNTISATRMRVDVRSGFLLPELRTPHEITPLVFALRNLLEQNANIILISGASAVTDRLDVVPQAIVKSGGIINYLGMPIDPGNLICFGKLDNEHIIVIPGCTRSLRVNCFDWLLDAIISAEDVGPQDVARMEVGGLLE